MRALFWLFLLFALAVGLSLAAQYNEGYLLLVVPPYRVEITLNLALVLLLAMFALMYALSRLLVNSLRLPRAVRLFRERRAREKAAQALRDAMRLLFEGRYGHAVKQADRAYASAESQGVAALVAARAAGALGDEKREQEWLSRAAEHDSEIHAARLMVTARLHCDARRYDAALEQLDELQSGGQRQIASARLALRAHQALGQWNEVLRVVRQMDKYRALSREQAEALRFRAHQENIRACSEDPGALLAYWKAQPEAELHDHRLVAAAVRALIAGGDSASAQRILENRIEAEWDAGLALHYADCEGGDLLGRISRAEQWLKQHPGDAELLLALGRLCRQQQLWGKAQSYLEASIATRPSHAAHLELARMLDHLGRTEQADVQYRTAAEHA